MVCLCRPQLKTIYCTRPFILKFFVDDTWLFHDDSYGGWGFWSQSLGYMSRKEREPFHCVTAQHTLTLHQNLNVRYCDPSPKALRHSRRHLNLRMSSCKLSAVIHGWVSARWRSFCLLKLCWLRRVCCENTYLTITWHSFSPEPSNSTSKIRNTLWNFDVNSFDICGSIIVSNLRNFAPEVYLQWNEILITSPQDSSSWVKLFC